MSENYIKGILDVTMDIIYSGEKIHTLTTI